MTRTVMLGDVAFASPPRVDDFGNRWVLTGIDGWDDSGSGVRSSGEARPQSHGAFDSPAYRTGRSISVRGEVLCLSRASAAAAVQTLNSVGADGQRLDVVVADDDLPRMSSSARVADRPMIGWTVPTRVVYAQEWWAADPLRYGDTINESTGFPFAAGGLEFPLFTDGVTDTGYLEFGAQGSTGRVTVTNIGTAATSPQFEVTGPTPPFSIVHVESGRRLSFAQSVAAGDRLLIDSATGLVVLNGGDVDYSGMLTRAEWSPVGPGESATFAFIPDGPYADGTLTVIFRPAWW